MRDLRKKMGLIDDYELIFIYKNEQINKSRILDENKELEKHTISTFNSGKLEGNYIINSESNNNIHELNIIYFKFVKK